MSINDEQDWSGLCAVGRVAAEALEAMREAVAPGLATEELDAIGGAVLERYRAQSAPRLVYGFPGTNCISLNDEVVHGIPGRRRIRPGDVVKLDVTAELGGYMADTACTVVVGPAEPDAARLEACARAAFEAAMKVARAGVMARAVGRAIQREVEGHGFSCVEGLSGHGIGRTIHEPPTIPNVDDPQANERLEEGMVVTIEPIIAAGSGRAYLASDGWTIRTHDGRIAAHYEHTVVIGKGQPKVLTARAA
jgi:methionyl aminopeptidase